MATAAGRPLHLRLFLEGVEVPVIGAVIQSQKNTPVACSLQLPANDHVMDLLPRTTVHLYSLDSYGASPPPNVSVGGTGVHARTLDADVLGDDAEGRSYQPWERFESTAEQAAVDLRNQGYKLIFAGELHGISFSKTPQSRSAYLQCLDFSNYWDTVFQYQVSGMSLGGGSMRGAFAGASSTLFNDLFRGSGDIVTELISRAPRNYPTLQGTLLGGLMNLIETVGGTHFGPHSVRGVNDFFSLAEMRLHLTQMVGANPFHEGSETRLLAANGFNSMFSRSLSGLGREVTIRKILDALQRYIFHEVVPINAPKYIPPEYDPNAPRLRTARLDQSAETRALYNTADTMKRHFDSMKDRQFRCNTPEAADRESDRRGGLRTELQALMRRANSAARQAQEVLNQTGTSVVAGATGLAQVVNNFKTIQQTLGRLLYLLARGQRVEIRKHTFYLIPSAAADETIGILDVAMQLCDRIMQAEVQQRIRRTTFQPDPPPRLLTQLYVPDAWMVAPPRCNVIFPEQYSQFQYARNFTQEVTRLMLRTSSVLFGSDFLFDSFYMVPANVRGQRYYRSPGRGAVGQSRESTDAPAWFRRDLMEHELYTGIVPAFERMSELNLHALRGSNATIDGNRVPYAILAANHIFYQYRFRTRNLEVSGPFNPYVVLGFPTLVIDKPSTLEQMYDQGNNADVALRIAEAVREGEGEYGAVPETQRREIIEANNARVGHTALDLMDARENTHYLGTPSMISHTLDVNTGGTTQIQMGYARTNNERSEFFGDNHTQGGTAVQSSTRTRRTVVACLTAPQAGEGATGYYGGEITNVEDVTDQYTRRTTSRRGRTEGQGALPLFIPDTTYRGRARRGTQVPVGVQRPAREYGPEVVALVGTGGAYDASARSVEGDRSSSTEIMVEFRAYRLTESVGLYRREERPIPPEDYLFPPWFGRSYRTERIGALYAYFFGTGALTDNTIVLEPGVTPQQYNEQNTEGTGAFLALLRTQVTAQVGQIAQQAVAGFDASPQPGDNSVPEEGGEMVGAPTVADNSGSLGEIETRSPIAHAIDEIVRIYSRIKANRYDVHEFVRTYTWRPIASMVEVFGTANLEITDEGEVVRGVEGFHSRAFGDFDDLRQLVGPVDGVRPRTVIGVSTEDSDETGTASATSPEAISARLDTRKEKRLYVLRYLYRQLSSSGIRG